MRIGLDLDQVFVLKKCFDGFADSDGTIATDTIGSILSLMARKVSFKAVKLSKLSGCYSCQNDAWQHKYCPPVYFPHISLVILYRFRTFDMNNIVCNTGKTGKII